jgi:hypothetical protein
MRRAIESHAAGDRTLNDELIYIDCSSFIIIRLPVRAFISIETFAPTPFQNLDRGFTLFYPSKKHESSDGDIWIVCYPVFY